MFIDERRVLEWKDAEDDAIKDATLFFFRWSRRPASFVSR